MQHRRVILASLFLVLSVGLAGSARAADHHLSAAGDDAHDGTAPGRAWRTVARANRQELRPGDRLLFQGGDTFEGNLVLKTAAAPSAAAPIMVGSFGKGRAVLRAGKGTGVSVENCGGIHIRDLIVEGTDRRANQGSGVSILNTLAGG